MTQQRLWMTSIKQQQRQVIFGLVFQHMITVQGLPIVLLLRLHLVRVLHALMPTYSVRFIQQKTHLNIRIPSSIALRGLGLIPLEMVPVVIALPRIAHYITFLHGEVLQRRLHHRMLHVRRLVHALFIQKLGNRKV